MSLRCDNALAIIALAASTACSHGLPRSDPHPLLNGVPSPMSLNAPTLDGQTVSLPVPRYITVVDVWDTSCEPCQRIMPALERLAERDAARVKVIGVALDDNPGLVTQKLKERGITYPNVVDADWQLRGWLRVDKIPSTVVFDAHGNIRWFHTGGDDVDLGRLSDAVDSLVREG